MEISKKKLLVGIVALAIVAVSAFAASTLTWTSCTITMHAGTLSVVTIGQYKECSCSTPFDYYDWAGIAQDNTYEVAVYIKNTGTEGVWLSYLPTDLYFYPGPTSGQAHFTITVKVIEKGLPCQMYVVDPPVQLPEKVELNPPTTPKIFFLEPGKVAKLDIELHVDSVVSGGVYDWTYTTYGMSN